MPLTLQSPQTSSDPAGQAQVHVARFALGAILVLAGALKLYGYLRGDEPQLWLLRSHVVQALIIEAELLVGFWFLSGLWPRLSYWVALGAFSCFLVVSGYEVISQARSCGCFGPIPVNPKITVTLDALALAALLLGRQTLTNQGISKLWQRLTLGAGGTCVVVAVLLLVHPDFDTGRGGLVVLRADQWIGKSFPLEKYLDDDGRLRKGKWIVLLYRRDCPVCETTMPSYVQLGQRFSNQSHGAAPIAFVEIPPFGPSKGTDSSCYWFKLSESRVWTGATPIVLMLRDGRVEQAKQGEDAAAALAAAERWLKES